MGRTWPALAGGRIWVWEPFFNLASERAMWLGASIYAREMSAGTNEEKASQIAEEEVYKFFYGLGY